MIAILPDVPTVLTMSDGLTVLRVPALLPISRILEVLVLCP